MTGWIPAEANTYTGIVFSPQWSPPDEVLRFASGGFLRLNEVTVGLTGVFGPDGQLIGLAVDASNGQQLMLPLVEIPPEARALAFPQGGIRNLGELLGWVFAQRFTDDTD